MTKAQRAEYYRNWIAHKHLSAEQKARDCAHFRRKGYKVSEIAFYFGISEARVRARALRCTVRRGTVRQCVLYNLTSLTKERNI